MDPRRAREGRFDPLEDFLEAIRGGLRARRRQEVGDVEDPFFEEILLGLNFVVQEPEDLRREPSALESEWEETPLPADCEVAAPWFEVISASLQPYKVIADAPRDAKEVRVGRDETDWWISTTTFVRSFDPEDETPSSLTDDALLLREALYVTCVLAEVDHGAWLGEVLRTNDVGFCVPMALDLAQCELPRQFRISIYDFDNANQINTLFLDNTPLSVEFRRAIAKLGAAATARGNRNLRHYQVPIRLKIHASQSTGSACAVRMLNKIVEIAESRRDPSACGLIGPTLLRLEGIEISMGNAVMDADLLATIERLILTDVRIHSLILPRFPTQEVSSERDPEATLLRETETRLAWSSLMRTLWLLGDSNVDTVYLGVKDMRDEFVAPFFSALAHARGVRRLVLSQFDQPRSALIFAWLAFALFSRASNSSIASLTLLDVNWRDGVAVDHIDTFVRAQDPVSALWRLVNTQVKLTRSISHGREVSLDKGTVMTVLGMTHDSVGTLHLSWDVSGIVVEDDEMHETITILSSGIGFCQVKRPSLGSKRRRLEEQRELPPRQSFQVETLVLNAVEDIPTRGVDVLVAREILSQSRRQLERLLRLVGHSLTALSLISKSNNDSTLETITSHCTRLQCLRLAGGTLRSMVPMAELCRASGSRNLWSLDLDAVTVPIEPFEDFLEYLRTVGPHSSTLRRLCFGGGGMGIMYRHQTGEIMRAMLQENKLLTHVHIIVPQLVPSAYFGRRLFHGELLPPDPLPLDARIALLSIPTPCFASLDRPLLGEIFAFAASRPTWRRMIVSR